MAIPAVVSLLHLERICYIEQVMSALKLAVVEPSGTL